MAFALWTFLALALDALAIAGQAIVGRCLGGGDLAGARAATRRIVQLGVAAGAASGLVVVAARPLYVPLFTGDAAVRAALAEVLVIVAVLQPAAGAVFAYDGILIGAGDGRYLAWAGLGTMVVFLASAWATWAAGWGLPGLWVAMGSWVLSRLAFLAPRAAGEAWLVPGAVRPVRARNAR